MTIDELRKARNKQPFVPFTIRMADGTAVTVRHPENLAWDEETGTAVCLSADGTDVIDVDLVTSLNLEPGRRKKEKGKRA
jgi:hypothetical protein